MISYAFICFYMLYMLLKLYKQAKVSEEEVRWSHVYRLFPAEAGKNETKTKLKVNISLIWETMSPIFSQGVSDLKGLL